MYSARQTSKRAAQRFEDKRRTWLERQVLDGWHRWDGAARRWLNERQAERSLARNESIFDRLQDTLSGKWPQEIDRELIEPIRKTIAEETSRRNANRTMPLVRSILHAAVHAWDWFDRMPTVPMYP